MSEAFFDKLDTYTIAHLVEIIESNCGINSVIALARTCRRMNDIINIMLGQLALGAMLRESDGTKPICADDNPDSLEESIREWQNSGLGTYDQWIYIPLPFCMQ